jgi:hypothetical protein
MFSFMYTLCGHPFKEIIMEDRCVQCKKNPVYIKKRNLCSGCYQKLRSSGALETRRSSVVRQRIGFMNARESAFASQHLKAGWILHPCTIRLLGGGVYTPDFWDPERKAFLELVGTRQAYYSNRAKYEDVMKAYPTVPLIIVDLTNKEIPYPGWTKNLHQMCADSQIGS